MHLSSVSRFSGPRRAIAGALVAALAFTSCGLTTGETAVEVTEAAGATTAQPPVAPPEDPTTPPDDAAPEDTAPDEAAPEAGAASTPAEPSDEPAPRGERADSDDASTEDAATEDNSDEDSSAEEIVAVPDDIVEVEEPADTDTVATDTVDADPADTDTDAAETETASFNQVGVAGCMDGVWASQPGQVGAYMARMSELTGAAMSAAGRITVALEAGHYIYDASIQTSIDVDGFVASSVIEGITQGNYDYVDGFIIAEQTFAEIDAFVELPDGTRIDAGALGEEFNQMAAFHEVPFDCTGGDTITLHFDTLPGTARFPMTFERQG